jgi:tetratricopeptide (TPR) repeat protein
MGVLSRFRGGCCSSSPCLLETDPTDAFASLILARVLKEEARYREAVSYFHRAIYGRFSDDPEGNRLKTRFELIDVLAERKSKEELLAQLLAVADEAPGDLKTRKRIGRLFLAAGSPSRAAEVFSRGSPG